MAQKCESTGSIFRNIMVFDGTFGVWFSTSFHSGRIAVPICHTLMRTSCISFSQDFFSVVYEIIVSVHGEENVAGGKGKILNCWFGSFTWLRTGFQGINPRTIGCPIWKPRKRRRVLAANF